MNPPTLDFSTWSNPCRFAVVERLLKAILDSLDGQTDLKPYEPVLAIARAFIGNVMWHGYGAALRDDRVLGVDVQALTNAERWTLAINLCRAIAAAWDFDEVDVYLIREPFADFVGRMAAVDVSRFPGWLWWGRRSADVV